MDKSNLSLFSSKVSSNTSFFPIKPEVSLNTREMILSMNRNLEGHLNLSPNSSFSLQIPTNNDEDLEMFFNSSCLKISGIEPGDHSRNNSLNEENCILVFDGKRKAKSIEKKENLRLNSIEDYEKVKYFVKVVEDDTMSSPDDEGPLGINTGRMFLDGETASKAILAGPNPKQRIITQLVNKIDTSSQNLLTDTQPFIDIPDMQSPIMKKLVILKSEEKSSKILTSIACCGFGSNMRIEYSFNESSKVALQSKEFDLYKGL